MTSLCITVILTGRYGSRHTQLSEPALEPLHRSHPDWTLWLPPHNGATHESLSRLLCPPVHFVSQSSDWTPKTKTVILTED